MTSFGPAVDAALAACVVPGSPGSAWPSGPGCCPSTPPAATPASTGGPSSSPARPPGSGTRPPSRWPVGARRSTSSPGIAAALPGLPPGLAADPAHSRAGRRHDRLAGHRAAGEPGQRPVLARPARPARMPAAVDARDRLRHRMQVWDHLAAATGTDSPEACAGRAGQPNQVVDRPDGFELRRYPSHLVARIEVGGSFDEAPDRAFRPLAGFVDGANRSRRQIAMTAPVTQQKAGPEQIAMTARWCSRPRRPGWHGRPAGFDFGDPQLEH